MEDKIIQFSCICHKEKYDEFYHTQDSHDCITNPINLLNGIRMRWNENWERTWKHQFYVTIFNGQQHKISHCKNKAINHESFILFCELIKRPDEIRRHLKIATSSVASERISLNEHFLNLMYIKTSRTSFSYWVTRCH